MKQKNSEQEKIKAMAFGYTSEWALAKFFPAIFRDGISNYFDLVSVAGREKDQEDAAKRLLTEIEKRTHAIKEGKNWRQANTFAEMGSCLDTVVGFTNNDLDFFNTQNGVSNINADYDAAIVFVANPFHLTYFTDLINQGKHIVCEKPLVVVTDKNHNPDRTQLNELEHIVKHAEKRTDRLVLMDAEHYSAKKATKTFYEKLGEMVADYGRISHIEAHTFEKDDPEKQRTRALLSTHNQTGLLLDMGVHLFGVISNIGGDVTKIGDTKYSIYPGHPGCWAYDVETYVKTNFGLEGELFHNDAQGKFTFGKFIDRFKQPIKKDSKEFNVTFRKRNSNKETTVTIDFSKGTVTDSKGKEWHSDSSPQSNEYQNIMHQFYNAIIHGQDPRTSFKRSIKNLNAIHRIYEQHPPNDPGNQTGEYQ